MGFNSKCDNLGGGQYQIEGRIKDTHNTERMGERER